MRRFLAPGWSLLLIAAAAALGSFLVSRPVLFPSPDHGCAPWDFPIMPGATLVSSQPAEGHCAASWEVAGKPEAAYQWYEQSFEQSDFLVIDRPAGGGRLGIVGRYGGAQHGTLTFGDVTSGRARIDLDLTTEP